MSRSDDVVDGVKQMILDGRLHAGQRLPAEKELAATLGVSRGSLREGVHALSTLGILESRHGDGTYVTTLDAASLLAPVAFVADLQDDASGCHGVRRLLETEAAGLAALHIDDASLARLRAALDETARALVEVPRDHERLVDADLAFHEEVARASGNPVLAALVVGLAGRASRTRIWRGLQDEPSERRAFVEHEAILAAVAAGDPDRARLRMATHLLALEDAATGAWAAAPA
ncbi:FadR/GntR family transcriptional regulator [Cellulomonas fengjieae]|uniref:FadR family transcriptional regulator n=1 Tax=Cellulomonas fengjieae TaxID=2819978 RepID=A0ABS3SBW0_9CELL|nr:FadR/GntR family transcriptional regulator [Cellulomonas fengjieae]MBO3083227.1 FadR family transcriptional regulator [Cellulomonas fengjieae]MBO3102026.1 FadR family transcriptional regulator [Cellulomonas fengjieae]QVI65417.1 FadR family transcriptional regulator [Cellulomonas fengjieae]